MNFDTWYQSVALNEDGDFPEGRKGYYRRAYYAGVLAGQYSAQPEPLKTVMAEHHPILVGQLPEEALVRILNEVNARYLKQSVELMQLRENFKPNYAKPTLWQKIMRWWR